MADTLDMAALEREHREWIREIIAANGDLAQRMAQLGITSEYDENEDILFVTIGPPVEALTETVANCVGSRVDPDTLKLVGLEILHAQDVAIKSPGDDGLAPYELPNVVGRRLRKALERDEAIQFDMLHP